MGIVFFIFGLLLFIVLILIHEWGHYIMARRNGVDVEEFGHAEAEQVKRRTRKRAGDTRSPRGARPLPGAPAAATPPSNRGVRSRNPKAKVRKTRGKNGPL